MNRRQFGDISKKAYAVDPAAANRLAALQQRRTELGAELRGLTQQQWALWRLLKQAHPELDRKGGDHG